MPFSPYKLYGQIESESINERTNIITNKINTYGSKTFGINSFNIPSYTNKVYDKFLLTSSITINTIRDATYCPFNHCIYFCNSNNTYIYSVIDDLLIGTISSLYTIYGIAYSPSSNRIFASFGSGVVGRTQIIKCEDNTIITTINQTDIPICSEYIPNTNSIYISSDGPSWGENIETDTLIHTMSSIELQDYSQIINVPSKDEAFGIKTPYYEIRSLKSNMTRDGTIEPINEYSAWKLCYCPSTDKIFTIDPWNLKIYIADPNSYYIIKTISLGSGPQYIEYYPSVDRVIFSYEDCCYAINPHTQSIVGTISGMGSFQRFLLYSLYNDRMYVGGSGTLMSFSYW